MTNFNNRVDADNAKAAIGTNLPAGAGENTELLVKMAAGYVPTAAELTSLNAATLAATTAVKPGDKPAEAAGPNSQELFTQARLRRDLNQSPGGADLAAMQHTMFVLNGHEANEGYEQELSEEELQEVLAAQQAQEAFGLQGDPNEAQLLVAGLQSSAGLKIPLLQVGPTMTTGPQAPGPNAPGWVPGMDMNLKMTGMT